MTNHGPEKILVMRWPLLLQMEIKLLGLPVFIRASQPGALCAQKEVLKPAGMVHNYQLGVNADSGIILA